MENIELIPQVPVQTEPLTYSRASLPSSLHSLPLLQQPSDSDNSIAHSSIASSSNFSVRDMPRPDTAVAPLAQKSLSNLPSSGTSPLTSNEHSTLDGAGPVVKLTPLEQWIPAEAVLNDGHPLANYDSNPTIDVTEDDSHNPDVINTDNHIPNVNEHHDGANESSPRMISDVAVPIVAGEYPGESAPPRGSSIYSTTPSLKRNPNIRPEEEDEAFVLERIASILKDQEALDLPRVQRARLYEYYICRVQKLRVLCDEAHDMRDLPTLCEEDYALLRTITRTNWNSRWWTIMIDDLICPECVLILRARRADPKSKYTRTWLRIKSKIRRVCLCRDNSHDFVCDHTRPNMNKVTRFFHALGQKNASRMVNIELVAHPENPLDIDVLASAVCNAARYFTDAQNITIRLNLKRTDVMEREQIEGIVGALAKLEAMLPQGHKLLVVGLETQDECRRAWLRKSIMRKWWKVL